ncbi:MAG: hypothetical protein JXA96_08185 [Sedimentisphaerales bacterium]|nr:hypothetical protein [Sedimentisphaerales bacterium]
MKTNFSVNTPHDEIARQAVHSLRGYRYQILQTLNAWLSLKDDEILLLEVAEDYTILANDTIKGIQVKDTANSGSVTLKNKDLPKMINSLWGFQNENSQKRVSITYLTTSNIGKEQGFEFPNKQYGIDYWHSAARGEDIEPIRKILLNLELHNEDISNFIKESSADDLRDRIIRQIDWVCGANDIESLSEIINQKLLNLKPDYNLDPSNSKRARDSLETAIFNKIIEDGSRQLTKTDLLEIFDNAVKVPIPIPHLVNILSRLSNSEQTDIDSKIITTNLIIKVPDIPLLPIIATRNKLISDLISKIAESGIIWIHGSSSTGKTILAQLIARQLKYDWLIINLRDCSSTSELEFRLKSILFKSQEYRLGGIILDDFPIMYANGIRTRLSMYVKEIFRMNGSIIITSAKDPAPDMQCYLGVNPQNIIKVPYLSLEDVEDLVTLAGGNPEKWAKVIHAFCGNGHPQLVQARIRGLKQRKWPDSELIAGIPGIGETPKEIDEQCSAIRHQLIYDLPEKSRELLYRLTIVAGFFDREMAIAIGETAQDIQRPGEELDILIGPWIEIVAQNCFRISPLVTDAGRQTLIHSDIEKVHKQIVDHLLKRHPFPVEFLGTLLSHALVSKHAQGLMWLVMAIMHTPTENSKMTAEYLFLLQFLKTDQPLFKENMNISILLRLAQFRVCVWGNRNDILPAIADQLIKETYMIEQDEITVGYRLQAIGYILSERTLKISPHKWMPLLLEQEQLFEGKGELLEYIRELDIVKNGLNGWSISQFYFVLRATALQSIEELSELFIELDSLEENKRDVLLSSLYKMPDDIHLMINSAWLAEANISEIDGIKASKEFSKLARIAEKWNKKDIAVECYCTRAVMLDEYANDTKGALESLDEAEKSYPDNVHLLRVRSRIYYHNKNYTESLAIMERIGDAIPKENHIERLFAYREAGISASELNYFDKAFHYFSKAKKEGMSLTVNKLPIILGLKIEQAVCQFKLENKHETLEIMQEVLIEAEHLNPNTGKKEKYFFLSYGNAILWMENQLKAKGSSQKNILIKPGIFSNPEISDNILEIKIPHYLAYWYQLAILETKMNENIGVIDELRKRTNIQKILFLELTLSMTLLEKDILTGNIKNFFTYFSDYIAKYVYMKENVSSVIEDINFNIADKNISDFIEADWTSITYQQIAKDAILALVISSIYSELNGIKEQLNIHANKNQEVFEVLHDFINSFQKEKCPENDSYNIRAYYLGYLIDIGSNINPERLFIVTVRIWGWLRESHFRLNIEDIVANYLIKKWGYIIENQKFLLQQPTIAVPSIESAMKESCDGTLKIAKLILAAEIAVEKNMSSDLRSIIQEYCSKSSEERN